MLESVLVTPDSLFESEQRQAEQEVRLHSPEAELVRTASRTKFHNLQPAQAAALAGEAFPSLIHHYAGGAPQLASGQKVLHYLSDSAASVSLGAGKYGVLQSLEPIAVTTDRHRHIPVDLRLKHDGSSFRPTAPAVQVSIPARLNAGVSMPRLGVSLTPVSQDGAALRAADGRADAATVIYTGAETDTDMVAKPTTLGFALDAILRSQESPQTLYFRIDAPHRARLSQPDHDGSGPVTITEGNSQIGVIVPVSATDAAGTAVPATMSVSGDLLKITVPHRAGSYQYPIAVDPEINDGQLATNPSGKRTRWEFKTTNTGDYEGTAIYEGVGKERLETKGTAEYPKNSYGYWVYQTQGISKIYEIKTETAGKNIKAQIVSTLELEAPGGVLETKKVLSTEAVNPEYGRSPAALCALNAEHKEACSPESGTGENAVHFQQLAAEAPGANYHFSDTMYQGIVSIAEPAGTHSTTSFNNGTEQFEVEVEPELGKKEKQKRRNALYGTPTWMSNYAGAIEPEAKDRGIGVSQTKLQYEESPGVWVPIAEHNYLENEHLCKGVQCSESHSEFFTLNGHLPDGEDKVRYRAEDAMPGTVSSETEGVVTLKVDTTKPRNLLLGGLPAEGEIREAPYELEGQATDGEGATVPSSGIKTLELFVDGYEVGSSAPPCAVSKGECTSSGKWKINGAELGAGRHSLVLVAMDNAGNEARKEIPIFVEHSSPIALGPGALNLESGNFSMGATDVSMGAGLIVSRSYSSRDLTAGSEGPLGPQWSIGIGGEELLTETPTGSIVITSATGGQTLFTNLGGGKYEAPPGDTNLTLKLEENGKKEKIAYYLEDAADHSKTKFTQPTGSKLWVPHKQEGPVPTDTVSFEFKTAEVEIEGKKRKIVEPTEVLAPVQAGISCSPTLQRGCRALEFVYATATKATETEWGEYANQLTRINFVAWNTVTGKMQPTPVAEYAYDNTGRLRAAWDPRTTLEGKQAALKTIYGYDHEGHLTAITTPGQQPWLLHYGTTASDGSPGRVLGLSRPVASIPLEPTAQTPKATVVPALTSPEAAMRVSNGTWSNTPLAFGYQWEDCNTAGEECHPIPGATNQTYTPSFQDEGHTLVAQVTATNAGGSATASSHASSQVLAPPTTYENQFGTHGSGSGQYSEPAGLAIEANGDLLVADAGNNRIVQDSPTGTFIKAIGTRGSGAGELNSPHDVAVSPTTGNWYVADYGNERIDEFTPSGTFVTNFKGSPVLYGTDGVTVDKNGDVWASTLFGAEEFTASGTQLKNISVERQPSDIVACGTNIYVTAFTKSAAAKVEIYSLSGSRIGEFGSLGTSPGQFTEPTQIACNAAQSVLEVTDRGLNRVQTFSLTGQYLGAFGTEGKAAGEFTAATGIAVATGGKTYVANGNAESKIEEWQSASHPSSPPASISPVYSSQFGAYGSGSGQFENPQGAAIDGSGHVWVTDTKDYRVEEFSSTGTFERAVGGLYLGAEAIATSPVNGNVYVAVGGNEVQEISPSGTVVAKIALSGISTMNAIAIDPAGDIWVGTVAGTNVYEFSSSGTLLRTLGAFGSGNGQFEGADALTVCNGNLYIADHTLNRVQELSLTGAYITQFGSTGTGSGQFKEAADIACDATHSVLYVGDKQGDRIQEFTSSGSFLDAFGFAGTGAGQFSQPLGIAITSSDEAYIVDSGNSRVEKWVPAAAGAETLGAKLATSTVEYGVPVSGSGLPTMTETEVAKWGQTRTEKPEEGTAIFPPDETPEYPATSYKRATIYYVDANGQVVNTSTPSSSPYGAISTTEYNEFNDVIRTLTPDSRATALAAGANSIEVSKQLDTESTFNGEGAKEGEVPEPGTRLIETLGPQHMVKLGIRKHEEVLARNHEKFFYDQGAPGGEVYDLVTEAVDLAQLTNHEEIEAHITKTSYSGQSNLGWELRAPTSVTVAPETTNLTTTTLYNKETGEITETREPGGAAGGSPHDTKTIYYGAAANKEGYAGCGEHPEWAGLVCETLPAKQPATSAAPSLPITETTYNIWGEPATVTETFTSSHGTTKRTKAYEYDAAARLKSSETKATNTVDQSVPAVSDEYNTKTGALEKQSTTVGTVTKTVTSVENSIGQRETYTDADGATTSYEYEKEKDQRLKKTTYVIGTEAFSQSYGYEGTTGNLQELTDETGGTSQAVGKFTATYDAEGKLTSEIYPNGMCANNTYNATGEDVHIEYIKTTNCSEKSAPVWYSEARTPSVRGETLSRTSTLAKEEYSYNPVGWLEETQETPAGLGCTTRIYGYDDEANRTTLTQRVPNAKKECATEGGTVETHKYDEGNRLIDTGVEYDEMGNITKLPAADAETHAVTSTFYVDNAVATQTQNSVTNEYKLDPEGRTRETLSGGKALITNYSAPGEGGIWTCEATAGKCEATSKWTRNIPGIDGALAATESKGEAPVLQLHDLEGDVVATAALSKTETKLLSTYNSTEFGVPNEGKEPPKFAWLGASDIARSLSSGVITDGATSYVPQTGKALQSEEVQPPGLPNGSGGGEAFNGVADAWNNKGAARAAGEAPGIVAAQERESEESARNALLTACFANPASCGGIDPPHILALFTPTQAVEFGEALCNCRVVIGLDNVIELIVNKIGIEGVGQIVEEFLESGAAEGFGKQLYNCGEYLMSNPLNRCALEIDTWEFLGFDTYIPTSIHVGPCYYYKKSYRGKKQGLNCAGGEYYKRGSY